MEEEVPENAPEHCPGTKSDDAGKASACKGCPNQNICSSGLPKGPDPDVAIIRENLNTVRHKILVLSGKGGVGKSTLTTMLARAFAADPDKNVAVLDIDLCGPSIPRILGVEGEQVHQSGAGWSPVYVQDNLCVMSIGFLLGSLDDAVIWRGPRKIGLIKQFLREVDWGTQDVLLIDTPPGTSDEHLASAEFVPNPFAILVTTPQEVALQDVRKELDCCRRLKIPVIGVVENMSGFVCPKCSKGSEIFPPDSGGAEKFCKENGLKLLGRFPLDPKVGQCCDEGVNFIEEFPNAPTTLAYLSAVKEIQKIVSIESL